MRGNGCGGEMGPCGGQVLPVRGEGVLGSPASGPQPRGHPELPVPRPSQRRCSPTPWPPHCWASVVPVQRCSPAGHRAYGSPREFWEVFSPAPPTPPAWRWGTTCFCGGCQAQWGRINLALSLPTSPKYGVGLPCLPGGDSRSAGVPRCHLRGSPRARSPPLPVPKHPDAGQHMRD